MPLNYRCYYRSDSFFLLSLIQSHTYYIYTLNGLPTAIENGQLLFLLMNFPFFFIFLFPRVNKVLNSKITFCPWRTVHIQLFNLSCSELKVHERCFSLIFHNYFYIVSFLNCIFFVFVDVCSLRIVVVFFVVVKITQIRRNPP